MKNRKNEKTDGSGIKLYFLIWCLQLMDFVNGKMVQAWPTSPDIDYQASKHKNGATQVRIDPDKVEVRALQGVITLQRKGVVKHPAKKAAQHLRRESHYLSIKRRS